MTHSRKHASNRVRKSTTYFAFEERGNPKKGRSLSTTHLQPACQEGEVARVRRRAAELRRPITGRCSLTGRARSQIRLRKVRLLPSPVACGPLPPHRPLLLPGGARRYGSFPTAREVLPSGGASSFPMSTAVRAPSPCPAARELLPLARCELFPWPARAPSPCMAPCAGSPRSTGRRFAFSPLEKGRFWVGMLSLCMTQRWYILGHLVGDSLTPYWVFHSAECKYESPYTT